MYQPPVRSVNISGLKSTPRVFRWGTIIRILRKYGADKNDINRIHREIRHHDESFYRNFTMRLVRNQE